ncbi:exopolyphosphatase [Shewanella sp. VB17]|uniref:Ppx/GppA phosphatase family protein n=1 Tax=Shewanella sp. VB17 TaxID=2739432 RepID=UPI0015651E08|nr:exopolyphosphatase [Shewanella sp. VB17]NRD75731.1 exopolyphosphatase [Shewanella sp. VB17]
MPKTPLYAAITLGSNSFNMLVAKTLGGRPHIIAKYKRKVRLADGILYNGSLSEEVLLRGLDCLFMFSHMLKKHAIPADKITIIATATLRNITNADDFCQRAIPILGYPIEIISGMREAELIYQGMVATTSGIGRRLVIDIGGASTEFIIGDGDTVLLKNSLAIGCVTFNHKFFASFPFKQLNFDDANSEVRSVLGDHLGALKQLGWHSVVGASGSVQSVAEILDNRKLPGTITLDVLKQLKQEVLSQSSASMLDILGISEERAPTFAAGLSILLALFDLLEIDSLHLSGGALREGVLVMLSKR